MGQRQGRTRTTNMLGHSVRACMLPSNSYTACRLTTGSAALLVCDAASALLTLQEEARVAEQRQFLTGSIWICRKRLSARALRAEPVIQGCNPAGAAALLEQLRNSDRSRQCKKAYEQIAVRVHS